MDMDTLLMPIAMDIMPPLALHLSILSMVDIPIPIMPTLLALFMLSVNVRLKAIPSPRLRLIPLLGTDTITVDTVDIVDTTDIDMVDTTDIPDTDTEGTVMDGANKQLLNPNSDQEKTKNNCNLQGLQMRYHNL